MVINTRFFGLYLDHEGIYSSKTYNVSRLHGDYLFFDDRNIYIRCKQQISESVNVGEWSETLKFFLCKKEKKKNCSTRNPLSLSMLASKFPHPKINNSLSNIFTGSYRITRGGDRDVSLVCKFVSPWRRKERSTLHLSTPFFSSLSLLREERVTRKWKISFVSQRVFPLLPPAYFNIWTRRNEAWREKRWKHPLKGTLMRVLSTSRNRGPILCTHPCIVFAPMIERRLDDSIISRISDYLACFPIPLDSVFGPVSFPGWNTSIFYWGKESFESGFHRGKRDFD